MRKIIKSPYFFVIIFLLFIGVIVFFLIQTSIGKEGYLLISNVDNFMCTSNLICKKQTTANILDKAREKFMIYQNNQLLGEYKIDFINKWNFFDSYGNWIDIQGDFIANSKNMEMEIKDYSKRFMNTTEVEELNKILNQNKIYSYSSLLQNEVVEHDFNKDGKTEKIILVSNATEESEDEKLFSIVIGSVNGTYEVLYLDVYNKGENYEIPVYRIKNVINIFHQKEDLLILMKGYFSEVGVTTSTIFKVDKKKFTSVIDE